MTDRDLLGLAAKAAGIKALRSPDGILRDCSGFDPMMNIFAAKPWNPLTDDGDALRLAVKLRLTVSWDRFDDTEYATATRPHTHQGYDCIVDQDPYAATRRAITRAAAEIGRAMK